MNTLNYIKNIFKKGLIFCLVFLLIFPFGVLSIDREKDNGYENSYYVPGEIIVKYREDRIDLKNSFGLFSSNSILKNFSLEKKENIKNYNISVLKIKDGKSVTQKIAELKNNPNIEYAEPNYIYRLQSEEPNDFYWNDLWGLEKINILNAWGINEGTNEAVLVAVIDDGVAYEHPDLINNMWNGLDCLDEEGEEMGGCIHGYDYLNNDKDPMPSGYHGTHVAGTIGAQKDNEIGIAGVAPHIEIMALKTGGRDGTLFGDAILKSISFAENNGARVINASFGGSGFSQSMKNAIESFGEEGGLFIAAAGNNGSDNNDNPIYPASYNLDNIISVAATNQNDELAWFSNYGKNSVHVGAPGVNILSTFSDVDIAYFENFEGDTSLPTGWNVENARDEHWNIYNHSIYGNVLATDDSEGGYGGGADTTITYSKDLNSGKHYGFWFWVDCEMTDDAYLSLEMAGDGENFEEIYKIQGDYQEGASGWIFEEIPRKYQENDFEFRFRWVTGESRELAGCLIDNVEIEEYDNGEEELYDYLNGTSMAAPHVSGLAALIWGYNPTLSYTEVRDIIFNSGDDIASLDGKTVTGKRINAYEALLAMQAILIIEDYSLQLENQKAGYDYGEIEINVFETKNTNAKETKIAFEIKERNTEAVLLDEFREIGTVTGGESTMASFSLGTVTTAGTYDAVATVSASNMLDDYVVTESFSVFTTTASDFNLLAEDASLNHIPIFKIEEATDVYGNFLDGSYELDIFVTNTTQTLYDTTEVVTFTEGSLIYEPDVVTPADELGWHTAIININGAQKTLEFEVVFNNVAEFAINTLGQEIMEGDGIQIDFTVTPIRASNKNVLWSLSDENVATINEDGFVTAVSSAGSALVTGTTEDGGFEDSITITAIAKTYFITFIEENSLSGASIDIYLDSQRTEKIGETLTTNESGNAGVSLEEAEYWFRATKEEYDDYNGSFIIEGEEKTVTFTMNVTPPPPSNGGGGGGGGGGGSSDPEDDDDDFGLRIIEGEDSETTVQRSHTSVVVLIGHRERIQGLKRSSETLLSLARKMENKIAEEAILAILSKINNIERIIERKIGDREEKFNELNSQASRAERMETTGKALLALAKEKGSIVAEKTLNVFLEAVAKMRVRIENRITAL
jgi:subtilisin family serine protease